MRKKFFAPLWVVKWRYVVLLVMTAYSAGLAVLSVKVLEQAADAMTAGDLSLVGPWVIGWLVSAGVFYVLKFSFFRTNDSYLAMEVRNWISIRYVRQWLLLQQQYFDQQGTGKILEIHRMGVLLWCSLLYDTTTTGLRATLTIILSVASIWAVGWQFGFGAVGYITLLVSIFLICRPWFNKYRKERKEIWTAHARHLTKIFMSKTEVLVNNKFGEMTDKIESLMHKEKVVKHHESYFQETLHSLPDIISICMYLALIFWIGHGVISGTQTVGDFVLFTGLVTLLKNHTEHLLQLTIDTNQSWIHVEKLWELADHGPKMQGWEEGEEFMYRDGTIVCQDLSFGYHEESILFKNFNLTIAGGQKTALVGPSGVGKSTLLKLLAGLLSVTGGEVVVDGQSLGELSYVSYLQHVGYLSQDPGVFDGTVWENLTFGLVDDQNIAEEDIKDILSLAQCNFIWDLEDGLQTEIGERGIRLSGGQKQRLAIAKLLLKDPKIVFLDEPTSSLDSFAEEAVTVAMNNLFAGRTVVIIAHRLQTVKAADEILVFGQDEQDVSVIQERGRHEELVAAGGQYARMLELQSGF